MRKLLFPLLVSVLLSGCSGKNQELERSMALRVKLLSAECSFDAEITADYADTLITFGLSCQGDSQGNLAFTVVQPESISGICGVIDHQGGKLTYADTALAFPLLADDRLSPVSGPWILLKALRGGYLTAVGMEGELLRVTIDDSYEEDALQLDIWLDQEDRPVRAEISYDGRRILTVNISNFQIL